MKLLITFAALAAAHHIHAAPKVLNVDCGTGETINGALAKAEAGDTIRVAGSCRERVVITTDRLTLIGLPGAIIQGGVFAQPGTFSGLVTVDGARGVRISGFTIQGSRAEGVLGVRGAAFAVENSIVQDNSSDAIMGTEGSSLDITNCTLRRSFVGLDVFTGSRAVLRGDIIVSDNTRDVGIFAGGASVIEIRGAKVQVTGNAVGMVIEGSSHLGFYTFPGEPGKGSSLTVSGNLAAGIVVLNSSFDVFTEGATITVTNNPVGISATDGAIASPFGIDKGIRFAIENNGIGMDLAQSSSALIVGGLTVRNNTTAGIVADNSSLIIVGAQPNPSAVTGNGLDFDLRFGSRATVDGVAFTTRKCEPSVLARGIPACP